MMRLISRCRCIIWRTSRRIQALPYRSFWPTRARRWRWNDGDDGSAGVYDPRNQINVTKDARQAAEIYRDPARKRRSKLDKLDEAAAGIAAGQFAPRPEERRCAACAFCYVCPSDPDSVPFDPAHRDKRQSTDRRELLIFLCHPRQSDWWRPTYRPFSAFVRH